MSAERPDVGRQQEQPLVSVIMNCFNGEKYLRPAIDSVIAQTYQNWEIVFWDNQSTDQSAPIFHSYSDPRLRYYAAPTHTLLYEARNYAIEKARGEFLAFLDVDDWWLPTKLEKQIPLFADPEVGLVCGNYWVEDERKYERRKALKQPAPTGWVLNELLKSPYVGLLTLVIRRSALASLDYPCDPRYHVIGDFDLVVRLAIRWKLACVQDPVASYRLHGSNESTKHTAREIDELESWVKEMSNIERIRNSRFAKNQWIRLKVMRQLVEADKKGAFLALQQLRWGRLKLRLGLALLLPTSLITRLRH